MSEWNRVRFKTKSDDYRPIKFPPPGPYWVSGQTLEGVDDIMVFILVAWCKDESQIKEYWPEAYDFEPSDNTYPEIVYSERFSRPKWYEEKQ